MGSASEWIEFYDTLRPAQRAKEPARRWRNRWRVLIAYDGWAPGDEYDDMDVWPTKEVAEEKAREEIAWDAAHGDAFVEEWAGAFPE